MNDRTQLKEIENSIESMKNLWLLLLGSENSKLIPEKLDPEKITEEVAGFSDPVF